MYPNGCWVHARSGEVQFKKVVPGSALPSALIFGAEREAVPAVSHNILFGRSKQYAPAFGVLPPSIQPVTAESQPKHKQSYDRAP